MSCHIRVCTVWIMLENEAWSGKVLDFLLCLENTLKAWTSTFENQYFALNFFQWNMKSMFFFIASTWYLRTLYMQNDGYLPQARCGNTPWPRQYGRNFTDYLPTSFLWMKALFFYGYFIVNLFQGILLIIGHYYIPRTEGSGDVMVLRQSRPPSAARRPPPAARNGVNAITQKPLDGLFSNLIYTLVVIVSWPD